MAKIHVKNWASFQHYKDRRPQWIKLHHELLDDYEFHCLPVASRALAPCIWLLASESEDGSIDYDLRKISFRLHLSEVELQQALKPLIDSSFIYVEQDASDMLAEAEQNASLEKRREETEREKSAALAERKVVKSSGSPDDLNSTECAIAQCRELGITDQKTIEAMSKQVQLESERSGKSCEISSLKVKAAAEDYDKARPSLEYTWGWKAFFGDGHWAKRDSWPWKSGREPTPIDKPRLTAKQKLDKQLEDEGIKIQ